MIIEGFFGLGEEFLSAVVDVFSKVAAVRPTSAGATAGTGVASSLQQAP